MSSRHIGLIANDTKAGAAELVVALRDEFSARGIKVDLEERTARLVGAPHGRSTEELASDCELLVVLGGDGTILQVLHAAGTRVPALFGINLGTLGFLTTAASSEITEAVQAVVSNEYQRSERTLINVEVLRNGECISSKRALNDAVISRGEISRLIWLKVSIGGAALTDYHADGLIVATPTGSTAYSLSAGGPLLTPDSGVFVVNPICPHVLTNRALIVSDDTVIEISPAKNQSDIFLTLDGQEVEKITPGDLIRVTKSPQKLSLAMLPRMTFFEVLRQKLKWSGSAV